MDLNTVRRQMIDGQLKPQRVTEPLLLEAFAKTPREAFLPAGWADKAYSDSTLILEEGRGFLPEPRLCGLLLQHVAPCSTDSVLIVGDSTGYIAGLACFLASVVILMAQDEQKIADFERIASSAELINLIPVLAAFDKGWPPEAPYDVIIFAGAISSLPDHYAAQLAEDGRLIAVQKNPRAPLGEARLWMRKRGLVSSRPLFEADLPLLTENEQQEQFVF